MRRACCLLLCVLGLPTWAQKEELFGNGKPPNYREELMDRRFMKTRVAKLLASGSDESGCVQLLGGLFIALAELSPYLHKRDENITLAPQLAEALNTQLSTPRFPATAYLVSMVRRVMIDHRMPDEWLATAEALNTKVKIIDVAKLKALNENLPPIDSAYLTIPLLKDRYAREVLAANSAVSTDVTGGFRDTYLDRDIAWAGITLIDIGVNQPPGKKGKKKLYRDAEAEELVAVAQYVPPPPPNERLNLLIKAVEKVPPTTIYVRLQAKQYTDIEKLHRGQRILVRGRFWEMNDKATELEVRDGLIFEDRDWSQGVLLAHPEDVATCAAAINELTGTASQPGGFQH